MIKNKAWLRWFPVCIALALAMTLFAAGSVTPAGKWHFVLDTEGGDREVDSNFVLDGEKVTGTWGTANVEGTFKDGILNLDFPFTSDEVGVTDRMRLKGRLDGETLSGSWAFSTYDGTFKAMHPAQ